MKNKELKIELPREFYIDLKEIEIDLIPKRCSFCGSKIKKGKINKEGWHVTQLITCKNKGYCGKEQKIEVDL